MKNALCVICFRPNNIWLEFLNSFVKYDIYLIVDDILNVDTNLYETYKNIHIIKVSDEDTIKNGFMNISFQGGHKNEKNNWRWGMIYGWERAVYSFSCIYTNYDNVWFLEDDVFLYNEQTLLDIDMKFKDSDLLSNRYQNIKDCSDWYHWHHDMVFEFDIKYYHKSMCCAVRISNNMLSKIKEYATAYKTLFFIEAFFPTICMRYHLKLDTPHELKYIVEKMEYTISELRTSYLYHPIKSIENHRLYRNLLANDLN
jgi:hypothetical protein